MSRPTIILTIAFTAFSISGCATQKPQARAPIPPGYHETVSGLAVPDKPKRKTAADYAAQRMIRKAIREGRFPAGVGPVYYSTGHGIKKME